MFVILSRSIICKEIWMLHPRTTNAQWGNSLHCMAENQLPLPNFLIRPKHILSTSLAKMFRFLWFTYTFIGCPCLWLRPFSKTTEKTPIKSFLRSYFALSQLYIELKRLSIVFAITLLVRPTEAKIHTLTTSQAF